MMIYVPFTPAAPRMRPEDLARAGRANRIRAWGLIAAMVALLAVSAWLVAGPIGVVVTLAVVVLAVALVPTLTPAVLLRMLRAVPLDRGLAPDLVAMTEDLARRAGVAPPRLYGLPAFQPQALAMGGPDAPVLAVSQGLLLDLTPRQMRAVLAHEISHLRAGDSDLVRLVLGLGTVSRAVCWTGLAIAVLLLLNGVVIAPWVLILFALGPTVVTLLELAFSRNREFAADLGAAELTGDPLALAEALVRIEARQRDGPGLPAWLRTHPPTAQRVDRLRAQVHSGPVPSLSGAGPWFADWSR